MIKTIAQPGRLVEQRKKSKTLNEILSSHPKGTATNAVKNHSGSGNGKNSTPLGDGRRSSKGSERSVFFHRSKRSRLLFLFSPGEKDSFVTLKNCEDSIEFSAVCLIERDKKNGFFKKMKVFFLY